MKTLKNVILVALGTFVISCDNDDTSVSNEALTEEEAVEIVKSTLARQSAGLDETTYAYSKSYEEEYQVNSECNTMVQDDYDYDYNGNFVQADYSYAWDFTLTCNAFSIPQSTEFNSSGNGNYTTPKLSSNDSSSLNSTVTGLQPTASEFVFNGTFERIGTQEYSSNFINKTLASEFKATISSITVSKSDYQITSGMASFTLTGTSNGTPFSYSGSITFNGNNTATLTINGNNYDIDWN
jgi:hypothetical protein